MQTILACACRRVQSESTTGTVTSERKRTILCIEVTDIHFDTQACTLRLNGKNVEENPHVKACGIHTR
jgi:protein pelota